MLFISQKLVISVVRCYRIVNKETGRDMSHKMLYCISWFKMAVILTEKSISKKRI